MSRYGRWGNQFANKNGEMLRQEILDFIADFKATHDGCSPATTVIADALRISTGSATYHIRVLDRRGEIVRYPEQKQCNIGLKRTRPRLKTVEAGSFFELRDKLDELERQGYMPIGEPIVVQTVMMNGTDR